MGFMLLIRNFWFYLLFGNCIEINFLFLFIVFIVMNKVLLLLMVILERLNL